MQGRPFTMQSTHRHIRNVPRLKNAIGGATTSLPTSGDSIYLDPSKMLQDQYNRTDVVFDDNSLRPNGNGNGNGNGGDNPPPDDDCNGGSGGNGGGGGSYLPAEDKEDTEEKSRFKTIALIGIAIVVLYLIFNEND